MIPSLKSSWFTSVPSRRSASIPASTHTALSCAALKSSVDRASSSKFTSPLTFIFRAWISMICARASSLGCGNSILRSRRPERNSAGSKMSALFVAAMIFTRSSLENPSSWFNNSSIVRCTSRSPLVSLSKRFVPIASISSMKMIAGAFSFARANASRTNLAPSPMNICTNSGPASFKYAALVCAAHARAMSVLPVPGGPYSNTPFGARMPSVLNFSACVMGNTTASRNSWICLSNPPMSL
mmetsp:Transcript_10440/g.44450  ORF Transcript_10440/g.44450 Transcript_10440/m.44450 type:complete len:241 (-) Transcript_10440:551-1273(-)